MSFLRSGFTSEGTTIVLAGNELKPWKDMDSKWLHFSGKGVYEGTVEVRHLEEHMQFILELGNVCDTFSVEINGRETSYPDQVLKRVDVTAFIRSGINTVKVTVVSNLYNRLYHEGMTYWGTSLPYHPRSYGIWETEHKKIRLVGNICV